LATGLGLANYAVATKFPKTWDLSQNKIYTLTEDTEKTLAGLKAPVHAYAFLTSTDRQYGVAKDLLDRYHDLAKANFVYEFVDPDKSPQLVSSFGIKKDSGPVLAIETPTKQQEKVAELNEEGLTNALVKITHQSQKKIYFTTGHGEADIKDKQSQEGYALVVEKLANEGINSEGFSLVETKDVPTDAAAVLVVGPHKRFLEQEAQSLKAYLEKGGRLLVMLDPQLDVGLDKLLGPYGIEPDNDVIIDPLARLQGTSPDVPIVQQYASSDITKGFTEYTVFPSTRSLVAASESGVDRPLALATTNPTAFGETDFAQLAQGSASPEGKKRGSLAVAILAKKTITGVDKRSDEARLVVFGSSQWANNRWSQIAGNEDFFMNTVSYLAEATDSDHHPRSGPGRQPPDDDPPANDPRAVLQHRCPAGGPDRSRNRGVARASFQVKPGTPALPNPRFAMSQKQRLLALFGSVVALAAAIGLYSWYGIYQAGKAKQKDQDVQDTLFTFKKEQVKAIDVTSNGQTVDGTKQGEQWSIERPIKTPGDKFALTASPTSWRA